MYAFRYRIVHTLKLSPTCITDSANPPKWTRARETSRAARARACVLTGVRHTLIICCDETHYIQLKDVFVIKCTVKSAYIMNSSGL